MKCNIIMTSPYPEMTQLINSVSSELGLPVTIVEDTLMEAAYQVSDLVSKGEYEVIISRAGTAQIISETVNLPVVHCDNGDFDLMQAFIRAKKLGNKIGFLTYPDKTFPYKIEEMQDIIGFEVIQLPNRNWNELTQQVKAAAEMGLDVIVGGGKRSSNIIQQYGMLGMHVETSERNIKRALIRAKEVAEYRIAAREKAEHLKAVIHVSEEGILFVNNKGYIDMFNPAAEKIFDIKATTIVGKEYKKVHKKLSYLLNRKVIYKGSGSLTTDNMIVTYEPVRVGRQRIGTVITCREIKKIQQLENQIRRELHTKGLIARSSFNDIQFVGEKMKEVIKQANNFAFTNGTILITGESGTGKELIVQGIHNASKKKEGPFVAINCAAIPESLLESELFGYADGAFTGAKKGGRPGVFELAHEGTIFLDEIGEISLPIQTRLLRVLQEKEMMRVGGDRMTPVNIRIVAATNRNLWQLVKEGKFRSDLYFRLSVLRLEIPPLRDRREDIPILVEHFLKKSGVTTWIDLSEKMRHFFLSYDWPGNIRQLENIVERHRLSVQSLSGELAFIQDILRETESGSSENALETINNMESLVIHTGTIKDIEKQIIKQMLESFNNNRTMVAKRLGISRTTLWKKMNS
jgi:transcriptional regulator with PAS, ATPase and Fis domain